MHAHAYDCPVMIGLIALAKKKKPRIVALPKARQAANPCPPCGKLIGQHKYEETLECADKGLREARAKDYEALPKRIECGGWIFPNRAGKPSDPNNTLQRVILPALKQNGILWHGWHAFRRGLATKHDLGVDDETTQSILRHSNPSVTQRATSRDSESRALRQWKSSTIR